MSPPTSVTGLRGRHLLGISDLSTEEITLILDEGEVELRTGDVVIQRGTSHAWSNRSGKPVKMLYVLIDAEFSPKLDGHFWAGESGTSPHR